MTTPPDRPRLLVVCQHFWPEAFRINDICDFLTDDGYEIDVLCGLPNYPTGRLYPGYGWFKKRTEHHNGATIRRTLELPRGSNTNLRIFLNYISFPLASLFHVPKLLTKKYDRIFIYQLSPVIMAIAGIIVGKLTRTPTTMYVLDLWPENLFSVIKPRYRWLHRLATVVSHWHYRHVDQLVALSETMKQQLIRVSGLPEQNIMVLPQVCEKIYETDQTDQALATKFKNKFTIVFTGNISPAQSFETILDAAQQLKDEGLADINWVIVGDGMSRQWLQSQVSERGLSELFLFEGFKPINDIPKYTTQADLLIGCLVKSKLLEATIPAKVMSYFAAGKPMVLAMDGEVQQLVNQTIGCGLAGPAGDANQLAHNIKAIHQMSPSQRQAMGKRGRHYHFAHFERNLNLSKLRDFIFR